MHKPRMNDKKTLAVIPARGGSKSIPRKNIKPIGGKPLLAWTVAFAKAHPDIDRVIVSTDDEEIARVAVEAGAEVPFMRPADLAQDTTPTLPVLTHCLEQLRKDGYAPDALLLLEPTCVYRDPTWVSEALKTFFAKDADSVIAVSEVPGKYHPAWQTELGPSGELTQWGGTSLHQVVTRRQDLSPTYYRNGVFYITRPRVLMGEKPSIYGETCFGHVIDESKLPVIDINTLQDWEYAEFLLKKHGLL